MTVDYTVKGVVMAERRLLGTTGRGGWFSSVINTMGELGGTTKWNSGKVGGSYVAEEHVGYPRNQDMKGKKKKAKIT